MAESVTLFVIISTMDLLNGEGSEGNESDACPKAEHQHLFYEEYNGFLKTLMDYSTKSKNHTEQHRQWIKRCELNLNAPERKVL